MLEDRRRSPPADHQIGALDAGGGQLPVDQQLLGRRGVAAVRPRPVRRLQPGLGERDLALLDGQGGDIGDGGGDLGLQVLDRRQVDVQFAADALLRERRDPAQPARRAAEELRNPVCATQIQMRVVLPGDADAAEHLDAVLGVGLGELDARGRRDGGGDRQLRFVGSVGGAGAASAAATATCSERSSISAHMCLTAWKLPIGLPNCSRTFAYSVAVCSVHRANPAASAASTVAARSSTRCLDDGQRPRRVRR